MAANAHKVLKTEDGYALWLRYIPIEDANLLWEYSTAIREIVLEARSPTLLAARIELDLALEGLLGRRIPIAETILQDGTLVAGTLQSSSIIKALDLPELAGVGDEGFIIQRRIVEGWDATIIAANTDTGVLYGVFHFLRHLQMHQPLHNMNIRSVPKVRLRMLNHWDNLDGTVERGYAGHSLWDWHKLPDFIDPRYVDYARANASIGINSAVLTNVNANSLMLTYQYLAKAAVLADVLRPYGIRVFLPARFSAPIEIGGLSTADPLDSEVVGWWKQTVETIYKIIPDFGGFVVKANSEGQPGPQDYGRMHADGANMFANALAPYGGMVIWRAFVYDADVSEDRVKQAYNQLVSQDGLFRENVFLQVKNGPLDFQPREPFHPLFGAMPRTPLMLEVQITQEYLGMATHLAYLAPLFKETLDSDTYCVGEGSVVARVVDGTLDQHQLSGMTGVSNIGDTRNWCGHPFAAANWYAFGRLAWDHTLTSEGIAREWLGMTFTHEPDFLGRASAMMLESREAVVQYMTPLGLHHIMAQGHHYGPGPWVDKGRADWTSVYYHRADSEGIGFDRTRQGSDAVSQYHSPYREIIGNRDTCPEELLLWFHHVTWRYKMKSGRILWDELCFMYNEGVQKVRWLQQMWESLAEYIDETRFSHVKALLKIQEKEARWWHNACLLYFQTYSQMPIPPECEQPTETLEYFRILKHYNVPGDPA